MQVELTSTPKTKDFSAKAVDIPFGTIFTDHMLTVEWDVAEGWQVPHIKPFGNLSMHPACSSLHYAIQVELLNPWSDRPTSGMTTEKGKNKNKNNNNNIFPPLLWRGRFFLI